MKNQDKSFISVIFRYFLLLLLVIFLSYSSFFYNIFLMLTIYPINFLLSLFYSSFVLGNMIIVNSFIIEIIPACVAVSAYILLLILNLTAKMNAKKRIYSLIFSFLVLFILNILRIFLLSVLFINNFRYFDITHKFFWYFMSIVFVICIWFFSVKIFKIKEIPVYSDFKTLIKFIKRGKNA